MAHKIIGFSTITHVEIIDEYNMLVALSADKQMKIYSLKNFEHMQTITDDHQHRPENTLSSMIFDWELETLVTAASKLVCKS